MSRVKVWSCSRLERCAVTLNNDEEYLIAAIIQKSSLKLNIEGFKLVAEDDGTSITDIEDLQFYITSNIPLLLLKENEVWSPRSEIPENQLLPGANDLEGDLDVNPGNNEAENASDFLDNPDANPENNPLINPENNPLEDPENNPLENPENNPLDMSVEDIENPAGNSFLQGEIDNFLAAKRATFTSWAEYTIPWTILPSADVSACISSTATEDTKKNLVHALINEMRFYDVPIRRKDLEHVALQMKNVFPDTFMDKDDDGNQLDNGYNGILRKLENHNAYYNRLPMKRKNLVQKLNIKLKDVKLLEAIQSGTVNWQPNEFPPNETEESLEAKRITLCAMDFRPLQRVGEGSEEEQLLKSTFALQRLFLNNITNPPTFLDITERWPILFNEAVLLWHFQYLTEISLDRMTEKYEQKIKKILYFAQWKLKITYDRDIQLMSLQEKEENAFNALHLKFKELDNNLFRTINVSVILNILFHIIQMIST